MVVIWLHHGLHQFDWTALIILVSYARTFHLPSSSFLYSQLFSMTDSRDSGFRAWGLGLGSVIWVLRDYDAGIRCTNAVWPHLHPQTEHLTIHTCITMIRAVSRISKVASAGQISAQFYFAVEYIAWDYHCNNSIYLIRFIHQFCHHLSPVNIYVVDLKSDIFFIWVYLEVFV